MGVFKRSTNTTGKWKELCIVDGKFCDADTGEQVDIIGQLYAVYGDRVFSMSTSLKIDEEFEPTFNEE